MYVSRRSLVWSRFIKIDRYARIEPSCVCGYVCETNAHGAKRGAASQPANQQQTAAAIPIDDYNGTTRGARSSLKWAASADERTNDRRSDLSYILESKVHPASQ